MDISNIRIGDVLNNNQIMEVFGVGISGGMRRNISDKTLILISDSSKGFYEDRWKENILYYTGMGKEGDQELVGQNGTLAKSKEHGITVHLLEALVAKQYTYMGIVELTREPYQEEQGGRTVWMFPLTVSPLTASVITKEKIESKQIKKQKRAKRSTDEELLKRTSEKTKKPSKRLITTTEYIRDEDVIELAERKASGICVLCEQKAPFQRKDGEPFLEVHHINWLSRGGDDTNENVAALCPNCHRRMHALDLYEDVAKLIKFASK